MRWKRTIGLSLLLCAGLTSLWLLRDGGHSAPASGPGERAARSAQAEPSTPLLAGDGGRAGESPTPRAGPWIRGRVVDPDGVGVTGLEIFIDAVGIPPAVCDAEGRFEIRGLRPGRHDLTPYEERAAWQGEEQAVVVADGTDPTEVRLVVPRRRWMGGRVIDANGAPAPSLSLEFRHASGQGFSHGFVVTDEAGRFRMPMREEGVFRAEHLGIVLEGTCTAGREDAVLVYRAGPRPRLQVRIVGPEGALVPQVQLTVRVHGAGSTGGAVHDVRGGLHTLDTSRWTDEVDLQVAQPHDEEGRRLALAPVVVRVTDRAASLLEIELPPARDVRGVVLSASGSPVAGIAIQAWSAGDPRTWMPLGRALSDEEGSFTLRGLPPEPVRVRARTQGTTWAWAPTVQVGPEQDSVTIRVHAGVDFELTVLDPDGAPIGGLPVSVSWGGTGSWGQKEGRTSAAGVAVIAGLRPDVELDLHLRPQTLSLPFPSYNERGIPSGSGTKTVRLRRGQEIRGTVVTADGLPFSRGEVFAMATEPRAHGFTDVTRPDPDTGAFVLRRLADGPYRVHVRPDNLTKARSEPLLLQPPAGDVRIVMPRTVDVSGRLRTRNVDGWSLYWVAAPQWSTGVVGAEGHFRVPHVADRPGHLLAVRSASGEVALLEDIRPTDGPFTLRPVRGGQITGRVRGFEETVPGAHVVHATRGLLRAATGPVAADGTFTLQPLPAGVWTVELWKGAERLLDQPDVAVGAEDVVLRHPDPAGSSGGGQR